VTELAAAPLPLPPPPPPPQPVVRANAAAADADKENSRLFIDEVHLQGKAARSCGPCGLAAHAGKGPNSAAGEC
jgi:hypothetical protein